MFDLWFCASAALLVCFGCFSWFGVSGGFGVSLFTLFWFCLLVCFNVVVLCVLVVIVLVFAFLCFGILLCGCVVGL